jgi:hypothetical protein
MNLNMRASAVLVWLPDGEHAALDSFVPQLVLPPPIPNPEPWWCLEDAIIYVQEIDKRDHGKVPWIKAGDTVLGPDQISRAYGDLVALRRFNSARVERREAPRPPISRTSVRK